MNKGEGGRRVIEANKGRIRKRNRKGKKKKIGRVRGLDRQRKGEA